MKFVSLYKILEYVVKNDINLSAIDRKFWLNIEDGLGYTKEEIITVEDFVNWYKSPLNTQTITRSLLNHQMRKRELKSLFLLTNDEINEIKNNYEKKSSKHKKIGYALLTYAKLKNNTLRKNLSQKKVKEELKYNMKLVELLIRRNAHNNKINPIYIIEKEPIFHNVELIDKLLDIKTTNIEEKKETIRVFLKTYCEEGKVFFERALEIILDSKTNQNPYLGFSLSKKQYQTIANRKRAKELIIKQDSIGKMKQMMYAALNKKVYQDKFLFDLIAKQETEEKMENLRQISKYHLVRKKYKFLQEFAKLPPRKQLELIDETSRKEQQIIEQKKKEKNQKRNSDYDDISSDIKSFAENNTHESIKKLMISLTRTFKNQPNFKKSETKRVFD